MGFLNDVLGFERFSLNDMLKSVRRDPERLLLGAVDPFSTKLWNKTGIGKDWEPITDAWGGPYGGKTLGGGNEGIYGRAQAAGINTGPGAGMHDAARSIAGIFAGGYGAGKVGGMASKGPQWMQNLMSSLQLPQGGGPLGGTGGFAGGGSYPGTPPFNPNAPGPMGSRFQGPAWLQKFAGGMSGLGGVGGNPANPQNAQNMAMISALMQASAPRPKGTGSPMADFGGAMMAGQEAGMQAQEQAMRAQLLGLQAQRLQEKDQFGVVNPSDFTPESMAKFAKTKDYGDLVPVNKTYGRYNPRDYTPESWAEFTATNDPSALVARANVQFRETPGGGIIGLDPVTGQPITTPLSSQAGTDQAAVRAGAESQARASGEVQGRAEGTLLAKATTAQGMLDILDIADPLIDEATGSGSGAVRDKLAAFFGVSTTGDQAIGQLRVLQAALMLGMPRMEGPQSDKDVVLYQQAAAELGDSNVPRDRKKAAVSTIRQLQQKYVQRATGGSEDDPLSIR